MTSTALRSPPDPSPPCSPTLRPPWHKRLSWKGEAARPGRPVRHVPWMRVVQGGGAVAGGCVQRGGRADPAPGRPRVAAPGGIGSRSATTTSPTRSGGGPAVRISTSPPTAGSSPWTAMTPGAFAVSALRACMARRGAHAGERLLVTCNASSYRGHRGCPGYGKTGSRSSPRRRAAEGRRHAPSPPGTSKWNRMEHRLFHITRTLTDLMTADDAVAGLTTTVAARA